MGLHELVARYGAVLVFCNALTAALGLPIPAMPTLIVVGASIQMLHGFGVALIPSLLGALGFAVAGGLLGDLLWFLGGRYYGDRTLKTLCKISLSRDTCVRKTERFFGRWGVRLLLVAKFVPGLSLVSVPLAGAMGVRLRSFALYDAAGIALWGTVGLGLGALFATQLDSLFALLSLLGRQTIILVVLLLVAYVGFRWIRRRMLANQLDKARISVDELYKLMDSDVLPVIMDIRSTEKRTLDPFVIPGAVFADDRELQSIVANYDPAQKIVLYCSCPNEVSAAWMAKFLVQLGFKDVIPLAGGLDAWRLAGRDVTRIGDGTGTSGRAQGLSGNQGSPVSPEMMIVPLAASEQGKPAFPSGQ